MSERAQHQQGIGYVSNPVGVYSTSLTKSRTSTNSAGGAAETFVRWTDVDPFNQVLAEIAASTLHVGDPVEEARKNTSRLSLDADHGRLPNTQKIQAFIHEARSSYATIAKGIDVEVLRFYAWFDEQAGQLRLSASSALALTGRRCVPTRLLELGFQFSGTDIDVVVGEAVNVQSGGATQ